MRRRYLVSVAVVASALAGVLALAQTPAAAPKSTASKSKAAAKAPASLRTAWGDPDLQGTWFVMYDVPLERSAANAGGCT